MNSKTVVIFSGRYQPFHLGHRAMYDTLQKSYPFADIWIATTGKTGLDSPFSFAERKSLAELTGIPSNRIAEVKNPYIASEILENYDSQADCVIFAVSEKDATRFKFDVKKNGLPAYLQKWHKDVKMKPFNFENGHAYVAILPVKTFKVMDNIITSATDIRKMLSNNENKQRILEDLYGNNAAKASEIINLHFR
jgi:phosphopantetheine adenylyltransferase